MDKERYENEYRNFLALLREARHFRKMTQSELAAKLGWTQAEVSKVETGARRLDVVELMFWLEALDDDLPGFVEVLCLLPPDFEDS